MRKRLVIGSVDHRLRYHFAARDQRSHRFFEGCNLVHVCSSQRCVGRVDNWQEVQAVLAFKLRHTTIKPRTHCGNLAVQRVLLDFSVTILKINVGVVTRAEDGHPSVIFTLRSWHNQQVAAIFLGNVDQEEIASNTVVHVDSRKQCVGRADERDHARSCVIETSEYRHDLVEIFDWSEEVT